MESTPEEIRVGRYLHKMMKAGEPVAWHWNWYDETDNVRELFIYQAKQVLKLLAKASEVCHECGGAGTTGQGSSRGSDVVGFHYGTCPTCEGTGKALKGRPDREEIAKELCKADGYDWEHINRWFVRLDGTVSRFRYYRQADRIIAYLEETDGQS